MLEQLWTAVQGRRESIPTPASLKVDIQLVDDPETLVEDSPFPLGDLDTVSGFSCIIAYVDSKARASQRRITCIRIEKAGERTYLRAYCHERNANRQFRLDSIQDVFDARTGELLAAVGWDFFNGFAVDHEQASRFGWGLPVRKSADLVAGLNALVFVARCDNQFHETERDAIERFVASFWLRMEAAGEPPMEDILTHVQRMSPDPEAFYLALARCSTNPPLCRMIRSHIRNVIDADGVIRAEEFYWGKAVDDYFRSLEAG